MNWLGLFSEITRDHVDLRGYDRQQVAESECFSCRNCFKVGPLTIHGRCSTCDSEAVQPVVVLEGWNDHDQR